MNKYETECFYLKDFICDFNAEVDDCRSFDEHSFCSASFNYKCYCEGLYFFNKEGTKCISNDRTKSDGTTDTGNSQGSNGTTDTGNSQGNTGKNETDTNDDSSNSSSSFLSISLFALLLLLF
jgi:hypothetical protein